MKRNILANECKAVLMTTCISQGSVATYLRGYGSFIFALPSQIPYEFNGEKL